VNALLAVAVAAELGLSPDEVQLGLDRCKAAKMRLQLWIWRDVQVLDDSYNANADSMRAALETLHDFPCAGRRVAVLGEMAELGEYAADAHAEIGRRAAELGIDVLITVGTGAGMTAKAAREAGLEDVREAPGAEAAAAILRPLLRKGDLLLLKASRAGRLERVGEILQQTSARVNDDVDQGPNSVGKG
jgi:UDP-N-acetylmuramoyl-tripeptide--D-alanyl-D-alanine ligase